MSFLPLSLPEFPSVCWGVRGWSSYLALLWALPPVIQQQRNRKPREIRSHLLPRWDLDSLFCFPIDLSVISSCFFLFSSGRESTSQVVRVGKGVWSGLRKGVTSFGKKAKRNHCSVFFPPSPAVHLRISSQFSKVSVFEYEECWWQFCHYFTGGGLNEMVSTVHVRAEAFLLLTC